MGRQLGSPVVTNVWIPDGYKDIPVDRTGPRERLTDSLDKMFAEPIDPQFHLDAVEAKLFGLERRAIPRDRPNTTWATRFPGRSC